MTRVQANLLLLSISIIWGAAFVSQAVAMKHLGPFSFTAIRFFLGALVILPFVLRDYRSLLSRNSEPGQYEFKLMIGLGLLLTGGSICQQIGMVTTTVTNAGFLTTLYVPLVPILGALIMKEKPHWLVWPASIGCFVGTWMLTGAESVSINIGDIWVIVGSLFWAMHVIYVGKIAARIGGSFLVAAGQFIVCGAICMVFALILEEITWQGLSGAFWPIMYAGVLSVGVAYTGQVVGQRHAEAADAAIILSAETLFAAFFGYLLMGDRLTTLGMSGCALIFFCILAVQIYPLWQSRRQGGLF